MADVVTAHSKADLNGSCKMVPAGSQFVWLRVTEDKKWAAQLLQAVMEAWRSLGPRESKAVSLERKQRPGGPSKDKPVVVEQAAVSSFNDLVTKKWCCTGTHQLLTRFFFAAERFEKGASSLLLPVGEEAALRQQKKDRAAIMEDICCKRLEETANNNLRDWLNRLWVLFVTGIDNDPAGQRALSYDVRKTVHDARFSNSDAVILHASLLAFLLPSLRYETCYTMAEADFQAAPLAKPIELTGFEASQRRSTPPQRLFTHVLIQFLGCFLDTLTEAEIVRAAAAFKPAVMDAQQRNAAAAKSSAVGRKRSDEIVGSKGDGIYIDHLDKLGRRKRIQKFA